jgi:myo-inositol 2-dehydrogenase / D-chiro-inositol 1-dehydrogenase
VTSPLTVGLVGCGAIGLMYAEILRELGQHRLVCLDVDPLRANAAAGTDGQVVASMPELLAHECDAAFVAAPTTSHGELVAALLAGGVPTFCEKPLTLDLAGTEALGQLADEAEVPLWVGFHRRFDQGVAELRRRIADGDVGRIQLLRLISHDVEPPALERLRASGSVFVDLLLHDFDLVEWLTDRRVVHVVADGAALTAPELEQLGDFDTVTAMLRLEDGTLAVVTGGRHQPLGYDVRVEVLGTQDSIAAGLIEPTPLRAVGPDALRAAARCYAGYADRFADAYRRQARSFLSTASRGSVDPQAGSWRSSYRALQIALAATHSARHGSVSVTL